MGSKVSGKEIHWSAVQKTAEKLNRSINSVKRKAANLNLNHYTDSLSAKVIARCFGMDVRQGELIME